MKKLLALIALSGIVSLATAQNVVAPVNVKVSTKEVAVQQQATLQTQVMPVAETLAFKETEWSFGKIPQGKPVTHIFYFTNTGKQPLILENVQASCGCTTPEWNKEPVAPGATAKITVGYNAMNEGPFTKTITATYNGTQSKMIVIKGEVWKTPVSSAPENAGLGSLKTQQ